MGWRDESRKHARERRAGPCADQTIRRIRSACPPFAQLRPSAHHHHLSYTMFVRSGLLLRTRTRQVSLLHLLLTLYAWADSTWLPAAAAAVCPRTLARPVLRPPARSSSSSYSSTLALTLSPYHLPNSSSRLLSPNIQHFAMAVLRPQSRLPRKPLHAPQRPHPFPHPGLSRSGMDDHPRPISSSWGTARVRGSDRLGAF